MSNADFSTEATIEALTHEVTCLKATLTEMLKAMGQADAGKVIINLTSSPTFALRDSGGGFPLVGDG